MKVFHDSEVPAEGQQVITACAFIHHNFDGVEKVFSPRRSMEKKFLPGVYELPGGHIDYGENIIAGLKRELMEELHVAVRIGDPFAVFDYVNEVKGSHSIEVVYFGEFIDPLDKISLNPEDHSEFTWFSEEELIARRAEFIPDSDVAQAQEDDPEYLNMLRGFQLLRGAPLDV